MKRFLWVACLFWFVAAPLRADNPLPQNLLDDIKSGTVLITMKIAQLEISGSGFVFQIDKDKDEALIVTNEHVISVPKKYERVPRTLEAVFHSGRKTKEMVVKAKVVAADADIDLAVIKVSGVKEITKAIDLNQKAELRETMTLYTVGYPFGDLLSTSKNHSSVTISKGTLTSIRENDKGETAFLQIDGDINPGNSGGPVIDEKGRLVGVAVAKLNGTRIGLAIPPAKVTALLNGRLSSAATRVAKIGDGVADVEVVLGFIDPLGKIEKVELLVAPKSSEENVNKKLKREDMKYDPLPDAQKFTLKFDPVTQQAKGTISLKVGLGQVLQDFWMQPVYSNGKKETVHVQVSILKVNSNAVANAAPMVPPVPNGFPNPNPIPNPNPNFNPPPIPNPNGVPNTAMAPRPGGLFPGRGGAKPKVTKSPEPSNVKVAIEKKDLKVTGIKGIELSIGTGNGPTCLAWAKDAKSFYHIDGTGIVRRISYPELEAVATLETGSPCGNLALSAEGLLVSVLEAQELWIMNPDTLKVNKRIAIAKTRDFVSSPASSFAYFYTEGIGAGNFGIVDLKAGKICKELDATQVGKRGYMRPDKLVLSPDGKKLYTIGGMGGLSRFNVEGDSIKWVEDSPQITSQQTNVLCMSNGGEFICAPVGGGNMALPDAPVGTYCTHVFATDDLKKPVATLKTGAYPTCVGFDSKAGLVYGQNYDHQLIVMDGEGIKQKEYKLGDARTSMGVRQFLVHPDGRKLLILTTPVFTGIPNANPAPVVFSITLPE